MIKKHINLANLIFAFALIQLVWLVWYYYTGLGGPQQLVAFVMSIALILQILFMYQQGDLYTWLPPIANRIIVAIYIGICCYAFYYFWYEFEDIAIYRQGQDAPATSIQWGTIQGDPGLVEVGHDSATPHGIASSVVAGTGVTAVFWCEKQIEAFSTADARIAHSVATTFANWFCGTLFKRGDAAGEPASAPSSDLMERMRESVDRRGRIAFAGSLAIVVPDSDLPAGVDLEQVVRRGVRSTDPIGVLSDQAVGILLEGIDDPTGRLIVGRILRVSQMHGYRSLRIGMTTFHASSDTVGAILEQAFSHVRPGGAKA